MRGGITGLITRQKAWKIGGALMAKTMPILSLQEKEKEKKESVATKHSASRREDKSIIRIVGLSKLDQMGKVGQGGWVELANSKALKIHNNGNAADFLPCPLGNISRNF